MEHFIERQNIAHYKDLLEVETDPAKRVVLLKLLAEEEAKQASHVAPKSDRHAPSPLAQA
jgi:hypothetical protein